MGRIVGIVVGTVCILAAISILLTMSQGEFGTETSTDTYQDVTGFVFDVDNSPVEVVTGDTDDATIEMTVTTGVFAGDVVVEQQDGTLTVTQNCPFFLFSWRCHGSFRVSLPEDATVSGTTSNGALSITGISGSIDVETSNGAVSLDGTSGETVVRTSNGAVSGNSIASARIEARTSNGRIEMAFSETPETVTLDTSNGSVEVILPSDSPAVALITDTSNGNVTIDVRTDPAAAQTINIDTSNGDITVHYGG